MSSDPPPGLDLSLLIAETQARLASSSTRARTGATAASGVVGPDTFHVSPGQEGILMRRSDSLDIVVNDGVKKPVLYDVPDHFGLFGGEKSLLLHRASLIW